MMSSWPDAYGYMGSGIGLVVAAICVVVWTVLPSDPEILILALCLFGAGFLFFMVGKAHENEMLQQEMR